MVRIYMLFHSTHETLKAESLLQKAGVNCRVVQKPASIRVDCGLAVRAEAAAREGALSALEKAGVKVRGVFEI
jgi:hypothetical protein